MSSPVISVVIPTRDRCDVLAVTLRALDMQEGLNGRFEVVVVDDGSSDATVEMLRDANFSAFDLIIVTLGHGGPARARNCGVAEASADRVLLLGDDTIPVPRALACHLDSAKGGDVGVQGMIDWDPEIGVNDVMRFLAPEGPQFWFKGLDDGSPVPWTSVVSSNLSAPRQWFLDEPFDEGFTEACMEDTELAWRWYRKSRFVEFRPIARCLHRHSYRDIEPFLIRQRRAGWWTRRALRKHPGLGWELLLKPLAMTPVLVVRTAWPGLSGTGRPTSQWNLRCRIEFLRGLISKKKPA